MFFGVFNYQLILSRSDFEKCRMRYIGYFKIKTDADIDEVIRLNIFPMFTFTHYD